MNHGRGSTTASCQGSPEKLQTASAERQCPPCVSLSRCVHWVGGPAWGPGPLASQSLVPQLGRATLSFNSLPLRRRGMVLTLFSPSCKRLPRAVSARSPGSRNSVFEGQGNTVRGGAWAQSRSDGGAWAHSCSDGGRGDSGASQHSLRATQPSMLALLKSPGDRTETRWQKAEMLRGIHGAGQPSQLPWGPDGWESPFLTTALVCHSTNSRSQQRGFLKQDSEPSQFPSPTCRRMPWSASEEREWSLPWAQPSGCWCSFTSLPQFPSL